MSEHHFDSVLQVLMSRRPFRVFTIEQYGGRCFEIDHRGALSFAHGLAAFTAPGSVLVVFDHESVRAVVDAPAVDVPNGPLQ